MSSDKVLIVEDANASKNEDERIEFTDEERRRIVRKVDIHLLPFISALYMLSFLYVRMHMDHPIGFLMYIPCHFSDRANIGEWGNYFAILRLESGGICQETQGLPE